MKKLKEKGITLVALVITIIILLIIVGISLANIVGSNGLFERTKLATEKYKGSENEESDQLAHVSNEIEQHHEALLPKPTINISISGDKEQGVSPKVQVSIKQTYSAGINVAKSKWTVNNSSSKLGIDESLAKTIIISVILDEQF